MTDRQIAYQYFLQSPGWLGLRLKCFERDGHRCQGCGTNERLQAHHRFYRQRWEDTELDDLVTLCKGCHEALHQNPRQFSNFVGRLKRYENRAVREKRKRKAKYYRKWLKAQRLKARRHKWSF